MNPVNSTEVNSNEILFLSRFIYLQGVTTQRKMTQSPRKREKDQEKERELLQLARPKPEAFPVSTKGVQGPKHLGHSPVLS